MTVIVNTIECNSQGSGGSFVRSGSFFNIARETSLILSTTYTTTSSYGSVMNYFISVFLKPEKV